MTGVEVRCGDGMIGEMRLDAGETRSLRARVPPTDDPDASCSRKRDFSLLTPTGGAMVLVS